MNHRLGAAAVVAVSLVAALGSRQPTAGGYVVFGAGLALVNLAIYAGLAVAYRTISGLRGEEDGDAGSGEGGDGGSGEGGDGGSGAKGGDDGDEGDGGGGDVSNGEDGDGSEAGADSGKDGDDARDPSDTGDDDDAHPANAG